MDEVSILAFGTLCSVLVPKLESLIAFCFVFSASQKDG